jgi:lipoate-protein ligase A
MTRAMVHATLLVDADLDALGRVLAGPGDPGNRRWELTRSEPVAVTSLVRELRRPGDVHRLRDRVDQAVARAFSQSRARLSARGVRHEGLTDAELDDAATLLAARYASDAWHADAPIAAGAPPDAQQIENHATS